MSDELVIDEDFIDEDDEFFFQDEPNTESQRESAYFDYDNLDDNEYDLTEEPLPRLKFARKKFIRAKYFEKRIISTEEQW